MLLSLAVYGQGGGNEDRPDLEDCMPQHDLSEEAEASLESMAKKLLRNEPDLTHIAYLDSSGDGAAKTMRLLTELDLLDKTKVIYLDLPENEAIQKAMEECGVALPYVWKKGKAS